MSCLERKQRVRHKGSVRRSCKHADGFGDISSTGSVMDETDREVSSLTDRAFKSLCIGDEAVYCDLEFSSTPDARRRAFVEDADGMEEKITQGVLPLSAKQEEGGASKTASTLRCPAGNPTKLQNEHVPRLSNGIMETTWVEKKSKSKVSSLIKAFTTVTKEARVAEDGVMPKDCSLVDVTCQSWDKSALMNIQMNLSGFSSEIHPQNLTLDHCTAGKNPVGNKTRSMDMVVPSTKSSKGKVRKSSKHKKLISRNFFLHSEFSPFQLWRECNKVPFENSDILPTTHFPKWYDSVVYQELKAAHGEAQSKEVENGTAASSTKRPSKPQDVDNQPRSSEDLQRAKVTEKQNLSSENLSKELTVGKRRISPDGVHKGKVIEKISDSEVELTCPPWRKNRSLVKKSPPAGQPCAMLPPHEQQREGEEAMQIAVVSNRPFSISQLLTPIVCARQEAELSGALKDTFPITKLPFTPLLETEAKQNHELRLRDSYKAIASSLLFNIKDNRKRVKSTYSPAKLKNPDPSGPKNVLAISEASFSGVGMAVSPKVGDVKPVSSPSLEASRAWTGDRKELADVCISDDYLTLSSPPAVKEAGSFKSSLGATCDSTSQAQPADLQFGSSPLTSTDLEERYSAPNQYNPVSPVGKETRNVPLTVTASHWFTENNEASLGKKPALLNGVDFFRDSESSGKEAKLANNQAIKDELSERHDSHVTKRGVSSSGGVYTENVRGSDASTGKVHNSGADGTLLPTKKILDTKNTPVTVGERKSVQLGLRDSKEKDLRKEVKAKHVFSARQNQFIKNKRYATKVRDEDEEGGTEQLMKRERDVERHQSENQEMGNGKVNSEQRGPGNEVDPLRGQAEVVDNVTTVNGDMLDLNVPTSKDSVWENVHTPSSGGGEIIKENKYEVRRDENEIVTGHAQSDPEEVGGARESSHQTQVISKRSIDFSGENNTAKTHFPPQNAESMVHLVNRKDKGEILSERRKRPPRKDSLAVDSKACNGENKQGRRGVIEKGNVRQKVLSYMGLKVSIDNLQTEEGEAVSRGQPVRNGINGRDEGSIGQRDRAGKLRHDGRRWEKASASERDGDLPGGMTARGRRHSSKGSVSTAKECTSRAQCRPCGSVNGKSSGERGSVSTPVQASRAERHSAQVSATAKPPNEAYSSPEGGASNKDVGARLPSDDRHIKVGKNATGKGSQKREPQHFSVNNDKGETKAKHGPELLPQSKGSASRTGESELSKLDEGGSIRYSIDSAKGQSQTPLSPVGKPTLFKVKDNTFRNSPIIRTVKLPFHLPCQEEISLGWHKESHSGSERGEDERDGMEDASVPEGIGLTSSPYGASVHGVASHSATSSGEPAELRRTHQRHFPIPEEEEGTTEQVESMADTEETPASILPTEDTISSKEPSERSGSAYSTAEARPQSRPPLVPPKTEKALRRAQRLTTRRNRNLESQRNSQGRSRADKKAAEPRDPAAGMWSPSTEPPLPPQPAPASEPPPLPCDEPRLVQSPAVHATVPACSLTQRKLLQDPDSGQYFVVDMPLQVRTKTFLDPETGMYVQLPVRSPEDASSPVNSSSTTASGEVPYMLYHGFVPMPVSSLPPQEPAYHMSTPLGVTDGQETPEHYNSCWQKSDKQSDDKDTGPDGSHSTLPDRSLYSEERDSVSSRIMDIMSLVELDELSMEKS